MMNALRVDDGRLRPVVSRVIPLDAGCRAFESSRLQHSPGKTILTVR